MRLKAVPTSPADPNCQHDIECIDWDPSLGEDVEDIGYYATFKFLWRCKKCGGKGIEVARGLA